METALAKFAITVALLASALMPFAANV